MYIFSEINKKGVEPAKPTKPPLRNIVP